MNKKKFFLAIIFSVLLYNILFSCTTAIISGKFTLDGRPLLWKNRDADELQNKLMYFNDGKFDYIALVNSDDIKGSMIWIGTNSTGFAIMNSASYNLKKDDDKTDSMDCEGYLMKKALQNCSSINDFQKMLDSMKKPLRVEANFGVIDANGNAAYFETCNYGFIKYDVNDTKICPFGYMIRTNYSFSGEANKGYGYIRYQNAEELLYYASGTNNLSARYLLQDVTKSLKHSLTKHDLYNEALKCSDKEKFETFEDYIPRFSSSSSIVIQGVKSSENPTLTTIWSELGFPLTSVVVPVWIAGGKQLPSIIVANADNIAPLCDKALKLKEKCFPLRFNSKTNYINITTLVNQNKNGILQILEPVENKIFFETDLKLKIWRKNQINSDDIKSFYKWLDDYIATEYKLNFDL